MMLVEVLFSTFKINPTPKIKTQVNISVRPTLKTLLRSRDIGEPSIEVKLTLIYF